MTKALAAIAVLLLAGACIAPPCPPGTLRNASGDCVFFAPGGDTDDQPPLPDTDIADPPPESPDEADDGDATDADDAPPRPRCTRDDECAVGTVCHPAFGACAVLCDGAAACLDIGRTSATGDADAESEAVGLRCTAEGRCAQARTTLDCAADPDCNVREMCHAAAASGVGRCGAPCGPGAPCDAFGAGLVCNARQRCAIPGGDTCRADADCRLGDVCHTRIGAGRCAPACRADPDCRGLAPGAFCSAAATCVPDPAARACTADADCPAGRVCHAQAVAGGVCLPACAGDADCTVVGVDRRCTARNRCRRLDPAGACDDDGACALGDVCHKSASGAGRCGVRCFDDLYCRSLSGPGAFCNGERRCVPARTGPCAADADCPLTRVCHADVGGLCRPECPDDGFCNDEVAESSVCNALGRCTLQVSGDRCTETRQCAVGRLCHPLRGVGRCLPPCTREADCDAIEAALFCNSLAVCTTERLQTGCTRRDDCPLGTICHPDAAVEGRCAPRCATAADCKALSNALTCNAEGLCVPDADPSGCTTDGDCRLGDRCHPRLGLFGVCAPACAGDGACTALGTGLYCDAGGRCAPGPAPTACTRDDTCAVGAVCHPQLGAQGRCAPACASDLGCAAYGANLFCNALSRCAPRAAGDQDDDLDTSDRDDAPEDDADCLVLPRGTPLTVDIRTVAVTFRVVSRGAPWRDPSGRSSLSLQSVASGARFRLIESLSDGDPTEPLRYRIPVGAYTMYVTNPAGQTAQAFAARTNPQGQRELVDELNVQGGGTTEQAAEIDVPAVRLRASVSLDGAPFPGIETAARRGRIAVFDVQQRREATLAVTGDGVSAGEALLFAGTYDVIFDGWLADRPGHYQRATLLNDVPIAEDRDLALDLRTVRLTGTVTVNGAEPEAVAEGGVGRGELWAVSKPHGDRFSLWPLGAAGPAVVDRRIIAGTYDVGYKAPALLSAPATESFDGLQRVVRAREIGVDTNLAFDVVVRRIQGRVTAGGAALPDYAFLGRGRIVLTDLDNAGERRPLTALGQTGDLTFDTFVPDGRYEVRFEGPLIDSEYFINRTFPRSSRRLLVEREWVVSADATKNIDIPTARVRGTLSRDGAGLTGVDRPGQFLTLRARGEFDDVAMVDFKGFGGPAYTMRVVPGLYDVRHQGTVFSQRFQYFFVLRELLVPPEAAGAELTVNLDARFGEAAVGLTINGATPADVLASGLARGIELHAIDRDIRNRLLAADATADGRTFRISQPRSRYDYLMRMRFDGAGFAEMPILSDVVLGETLNETRALTLVPVRVAVTLDGRPMPDDAADASRGDVILRLDSDFQVLADADFGPTGAIERTILLRPGRWSANLATGYATTVLPRNIWTSLGCVDVRE